MITPTCPFCGAEAFPVHSRREFRCLTSLGEDGELEEGVQCVTRQRDQLAARVKELDDARTKAAANSLATMLAYEDAMKRIYELESESDLVMSKAMAWKAYAERLEGTGDSMTFATRDEAAIAIWTKAKETKP